MLQGLNTNQQILHRANMSRKGSCGSRPKTRTVCGLLRRRRCNISALVSRSSEREARRRLMRSVATDGRPGGGFGCLVLYTMAGRGEGERREVWLLVRLVLIEWLAN